MALYILDLSEVKLIDQFWGDHTEILCTDGMYEHTYDVLMSKLPTTVFDKVKKHRVNNSESNPVNQDWPIGFSEIPVGAKLIRTS